MILWLAPRLASCFQEVVPPVKAPKRERPDGVSREGMEFWGTSIGAAPDIWHTYSIRDDGDGAKWCLVE